MRRRRPPFSVATRRPPLLGRSLFASGQRNAKQKLGFLKNRGVPPELIEKLAPYTERARGRDLEWFAQQISEELQAAGPRLNAMIAKEAEMLGEFGAVIDWLVVQRPNYSGMSWRQAKQRSDAWHAALADKRPRKERMRSRDVVMELPDNWVWVKIPKKEYRAEGIIMGNCFGESFKARTAYSLRDPWNRPHVTLSVLPTEGGRGWTFMEAKGKGNAIPVTPYAKMTVEFLRTLPFGASLEVEGRGNDLRKIVALTAGQDVLQQSLLLDEIAPMRGPRERAKLTLDVRPPEAVRARITRKNHRLIPDFYGADSVQFLLRKLEKERSPARMAEWSRTVVGRLDTYAELLERATTAEQVTALWKELQAELGHSVKVSKNVFAALKRKARSSKVRDRLVAAALLPPNSLSLFADDGPPVWALAATRAGPRAAMCFLESAISARDEWLSDPEPQAWGTRSSPGGRMFVPGLIWKIPEKDFRKMWRRMDSIWTPRDLGPYSRDVLNRANELGLDITEKLDLNLVNDTDDLQFVGQLLPFEKLDAWAVKFYNKFHDEADDWGGDLEACMHSQIVGKFLAASPAYGLDWSGPGSAVVDNAITWLWGRPKAAKRMAKAMDQADFMGK